MSKIRPNKFKDKNDVHVNGRFYELGSSEEMFIHIKWQFHRYLEQVINNPSLPNPFESYEDPELRKLLTDDGIIGLTQKQIIQKAQDYFDYLAKGGKPYSDKLHGEIEWSISTVNNPVSVLINRETGDWCQMPAVLGEDVTLTQQ
tara:strand:- start:376 stop:810 length:435 start_codon:yes stop_codon:yes gene_type:complete